MKEKSRLRRFFRRYGADYAFVAPYTILFTVFSIVPVVMSMGLSLTYFNVLETPVFNGISNYLRLFLDDKLFLTAVKNTLLISVITGPIGFLLSYMLAWLISQFNPKLRAFFTLLFYAPSMSGSVYLIWQLILSNDSHGLLNGFLMSMGFIQTPILWLQDTKYMLGGAIAMILWMSLGTSFLSFIAGFMNVDKTLYEAGAIDGIRNRVQELWFITLPSMRPQLMFGAVMSITSSFGVGDIISGIYGFPSTNYALHTMTHHLQDYGNNRFEMGYASAIATVLFLIMFFTNKLVQKLIGKLGR